MNDDELIREFASSRSEQAFRRLVDRHCDLVFSVASRVTQNPDLARDVSQQVFSKLAARPGAVATGVPLSAWLHRTCRSLAIDLVRSEEARRKREVTLSASPLMNAEPSPDWSALEPVIDSLIDELPELERRAVVMRFYEKRSHGAIGASLGLTEEAARKRLDRALERLRGLLAKRGIATSSAALATILPAHAVTTAPAGLAASLSSTALSTATLTAATATATTSTLIAFMTNKATIAGASLLLLAGVGAIAVPTLKKDKPAGTATAAASSSGATSAPGAPGAPGDSSSAQSRAKGRGAAANEKLAAKYGDARTKLSAHLYGEFVGLLEDTAELMAMAHKMELGQEMAGGPEEVFGDKTAGLALTEEQAAKITELNAASVGRQTGKIHDIAKAVKADPAKFTEFLLIQDGLKRGEVSRAEYDEFRSTIEMPDDELSFTLNDESEGGPLDDEIFLQELAKILDERQQGVIDEMVKDRPKNGDTSAEEPVSLEEMEQKLAGGRKVIRGALQLIEGMTDGGFMPDKK